MVKKSKSKTNKSRSEALKKYWQEVHLLQDLYGLSVKSARKKLSVTPKYAKKKAERTGKDILKWDDAWKKAKKMTKTKQKKYISNVMEEFVMES